VYEEIYSKSLKITSIVSLEKTKYFYCYVQIKDNIIQAFNTC